MTKLGYQCDNCMKYNLNFQEVHKIKIFSKAEKSGGKSITKHFCIPCIAKIFKNKKVKK